MDGAQVHEFLRFHPGSEEARRLDAIQNKALSPVCTIDWELLAELKKRARTEALLPQPWRRIFSIREPQYRVLVLEFCSTFTFNHQSKKLTDKKAIHFKLCGKPHDMSVAQLGVLMGIYEEREVKKHLFTKGLKSVGDNVPAELWSEIGLGQYNSMATKSTRMKDPLHRYIHRAVAHTISARGESNGVVSTKDMFFMYCIIHQKPCYLAYALASFFTTCTGRRLNSPICGGAYITRLAKSLGVLTDEISEGLQPSHPTRLIDKKMVRSMKLATLDREDGWYWLDLNGKKWSPSATSDDGDIGMTVAGNDGGSSAGVDASSDDVAAGDVGARTEPLFGSREAVAQPPPPPTDQVSRLDRLEVRMQWVIDVLMQQATAGGYMVPTPPFDLQHGHANAPAQQPDHDVGMED